VVAATYGAELIAMNEETAAEALRNHPARTFSLSGDDDAEPLAIYQEHDVLLSRILGERPDGPDR